MVFEKAQQIVTRETTKEGIFLDEKAKLEVAKTKENLSYYRKITEGYIDKLTYNGRQQDKRNYISKLWTALRDVLKDKKGTKEEMEKVRKDLSGRSESLKEKIIAQQRAHESLKFKAVKELNNENISKADFGVGVKRLQDFKQSLSPLNQTDKSGNIDERQLRLDLQVQEQIDSLKNLKKLYEAKYQKGTVFISSGQKYYVHSANNGVVEFSPYKQDETKKGSKAEIGKKQKMNWIEFQRMTEKAGCKVKKLQGNEYKDFDVDADKEVVESRAKIEELKRLKEINYIFSGKILDSIKDPKQKELMKQGIEEHYNSMRLYFEKDSNGVVKPTEVYNSLSVENRVKALIKMLSGINSVIEKIKLKETLEKEKDPIKKLFFQAEMSFKSGDNMQAYAHFRAFKKKTDLWGYRNYQAQFSKLANSWDLPGAIKIAEGRLRQLSFKLINTAEKYVVSAIRQKASGLFISGEVAKKTYKETMQVLNGMRKALRSGDAYDVGTAWQKIGMPWMRAREDRMKGLKFGDLGRSETHLRIFHMPMILKLTDVALITNKEEQKKKLLTLADDGRKTKFRGPASVLYKEYMQDDLHKFEKGKMKTKKYWEEKRKTYMALKKSTNPVIAAYRDDAKEIAMKSIGKEKFKKLSDEQKKILTERYEHMLLENDVNNGATKDLFKSFLKSVKGDNKAAAKYIDMEDPFDEWFKLSDAGADTVKEIAGEAVVLACSGGLGNLAGRGVTAGLRTLAKKSAEKLAVRLATAGAGIAVDLVVSEIIDRSLRTVLMGQKGLFSKKELMNALKHSVATYGVLSLGGRVSGVAMRRLENASQLTKYAARVGQVVGMEAPLMATLNHGFSGWEGKWIDHYGQSMMTILTSRAGMKLLHGSTDNMLLKAEHAMEFKARLHTLKAKDPAKGALIDGMLKSGDLPKESVVQLMDSKLSTTEMKKLSKYMDDPKNAGFLLAIKYAEEHGTMTKKMKDQYQEHLLDLRMMGFSKSQAAKFAKSMTLQGLLSKYGKGSKKVAKEQLDSAIREQKVTEAKQWMKDNLSKVKGWLKNPNIKEAFVTYMYKAQGNYAQFLQKYPKLAKIIPKDLTKLRIIPVPVVAAACGVPLTFKSASELRINNALRLKPGDQIKIKTDQGDHRTLKILSIDTNQGIVKVHDWTSNRKESYSAKELKRSLNRRIDEEANTSPEGERLLKAIHTDELINLLKSGHLHEKVPELARIFGEESYQHVAHQHEKIGDHTLQVLKKLRESKQYKELVKNNPRNKTILELATLFHDIGKKGYTKDDPDRRQPDHSHEEKCAQVAEKVLQKMKIPKDIQDKVVQLVRLHSAGSEIALKRLNPRYAYNPDNLSPVDLAISLKDKNSILLLKALNYADVQSVNPKITESFKNSTRNEMDKVYDAAIKYLEQNPKPLENLVKRLEKIGLHAYADSVGKADSSFSGIDGTDISTFERRTKLVEKLEKLHAKINDKLDYLEKYGYRKELNTISNYSNDKYATLEERLKAAEKMTQDVEDFKAKYNITSGNLARGIEMVNFRSDEGKTLKKLLDKQRAAKNSKDPKKALALNKNIKALVKPVFGEGSTADKRLQTLINVEDIKTFSIDEFAKYCTNEELPVLQYLRENNFDGIYLTNSKIHEFTNGLSEVNSNAIPVGEKLKLFIAVKKEMAKLHLNPIDAETKATLMKRFNDCLQMIKDGKFGSDLHHGTNSNIFKQLTPGNPELLSGAELQRRGIVTESGEKDIAGGTGQADFIYAGQDRDGLGAARAYAELNRHAEGYADPKTFSVYHLRDRIDDFSRAIALVESANHDELQRVRFKTRITLKALKRLKRQYKAALDEKLNGHDDTNTEPYQIIFGLKESGNTLIHSESRDYKGLLSGEVKVQTPSISLKKNLETIYVPEANIQDAKRQLARLLGPENAKKVKVYSIESLDTMGSLLGNNNPYETTYSNTYNGLDQNIDISLRIIDRELIY